MAAWLAVNEKRGPTPKENAGRRAGGRHAFARRRAHDGLSRHLARRPLALHGGEISRKLGRACAARTMTADRKMETY
jgi:hypothetical protein